MIEKIQARSRRTISTHSVIISGERRKSPTPNIITLFLVTISTTKEYTDIPVRVPPTRMHTRKMQFIYDFSNIISIIRLYSDIISSYIIVFGLVFIFNRFSANY